VANEAGWCGFRREGGRLPEVPRPRSLTGQGGGGQADLGQARAASGVVLAEEGAVRTSRVVGAILFTRRVERYLGQIDPTPTVTARAEVLVRGAVSGGRECQRDRR
jgi:hypothetical protein